MILVGVDEVGRGPIAGPVVAAAASFEQGYTHPEITDSKKLSRKKREKLYDVITREALDWTIVSLSEKVIDRINIREAARLAMGIAVREIKGDQILVDGNMEIECSIPQQTVIGGDAKHVEIGAASILAKVWRDRFMCELDVQYPGYDLSKHAGYPTKAHKEAVALLGPSPVHRRSFRGVKEYCELTATISFRSIEEESRVIRKPSEPVQMAVQGQI